MPKATYLAAAAAVSLGVAFPRAGGSVAGRVSFLENGGRPTPDAQDTVVWVDGARGTLKPQHAVVTMKNKQFRPGVVAVPVGGTVLFPNADPILHNAFSVSGVNRFDLDLYRSPRTGAWIFRHPGIVRVYCNIHPQMAAVVVVRDNPYFTQTGADGSFNIDDVPAGRYTLKAWHPRGGETAQALSVPAAGLVRADLSLDASAFKRAPHKNKYGRDYGAADRY